MPKNEVDDFLSQVKGEKQAETFVEDESDPLKEGEQGTKEGEVEDDEKPLPFHKDPKVQRYIEKEINRRIPTTKAPEVEKVSSSETEDELTETLIEIIGNDTPQKIAAVKKFRSQLGRLEERGADRALEQIRQQAEAEQAEEAEAQKQLVDAFDAIEEEFDIDLTSNTTTARKERNDFIDFIKRVSPKDADGDVVQYPDFSETYKLFKSTQKPADNKKAKDISSRSMSRSTDSSSTPTTGKTWKDVDKAFARLSN